MPYFLFAQTEFPLQEDFWKPIALPFSLTVVGVVIYGIVRSLEAKGKASSIAKWIGLLPMVIGGVAGWGPFANIRDGAYYAIVRPLGDKTVWGHYAAFLFPVFGVVGLAIWFAIDKFSPEKSEDDDLDDDLA